MTRAAAAFALRAAWARRRRWLSFVLVVAVGLALVSATAGVAGRAGSAASETADRDGAGRVVEIEIVDAGTGTSERLSARNVAAVAAIPGVRAVLPTASAALGLKTDTVPGIVLRTATLRTVRPPMLAPKGDPPRLGRGDILVPATTQDSDLRPLVGQRVPFESQRAVGVGRGVGVEQPFRIVGVYDPVFQVDGADVAYVSTADARALAARANGLSTRRYLAQVGYDAAEVVVGRDTDVDGVIRAVQRLRLPATTLAQRYSELPTVLDLSRTIGRGIGLILVLLVAIAAAAQTSATVRARWSELGLLRATGFGRGQATIAFAGEASLVLVAAVALGIVLSIPAGVAFVAVAGDAARIGGAAPSPWPAVGPVALFSALLLLAGALGSVLAAARATRINPSLLLRD
jgi:putative ABC transport system permease protein